MRNIEIRNDFGRFRAAPLLWAQNLARTKEKPRGNKLVLGLGERMCKFFRMPLFCRQMKSACIYGTAIALAMLNLTLPGQEWTRFRGPNGTGISQVKTIPAKIGQADLNWK